MRARRRLVRRAAAGAMALALSVAGCARLNLLSTQEEIVLGQAAPRGPAVMSQAAAGEDQEPPPDQEGQEGTMICRNLTKGNVVASRVVVATTFQDRRRGLLDRKTLPSDEGMLLIPCRSVHTMGMKFPIDIVFLDKQMHVAKILPSVKPGRMPAPVLKAYGTLELAAGTAEAKRLEVGDRLLIETAPEPQAKEE